MRESDRIKKYYNSDENIHKYAEAIDKVGLWNSEKVVFSKYIKKSDKILDLGCGAGRTTINLFKMGYNNIVGLDIAENLIAYAKEYSKQNNLKIDFQVGDATKLSFDDESFDVAIFSFNGMENIVPFQNRVALFTEVGRILKSGGYFIFTAHDRHDPKHLDFWKRVETNWEKGINELGVENLGDMFVDVDGEKVGAHFYTIEELKEFIPNKLFKIEYHEYSNKIAEETDVTRKFAQVTVFWVLKKK